LMKCTKLFFHGRIPRRDSLKQNGSEKEE